MKQFAILTVLAFLLSFPSNGQEPAKKKRQYITWVTFMDGSEKQKGILLEVKEKSVIVNVSKINADYTRTHTESEFHVETILAIYTRQKNSLAIGAGAGFAGGFILGGAIGMAAGDDPPIHLVIVESPGMTKEAKALLGGFIGGIGGCLLGTGLGAIRTSYPIDGSLQNFESHREKLQLIATRQ